MQIHSRLHEQTMLLCCGTVHVLFSVPSWLLLVCFMLLWVGHVRRASWDELWCQDEATDMNPELCG